jgi:Concanavalin A-like lectin/glucanases superfamily/Calcineurin-like phosphoesterase
MCRLESENPPSQTSKGPGRRAFLRTAGLVGAGAAAVGPLTAVTAGTASAAVSRSQVDIGRWNPDPESPRFTLAVMPDTQFLYWGSQGSINPEPQEESFRYVIDNSGATSGSNIVFMAHLGDLTEDAQASSFHYVGQAFDILDSSGVAYSVLAGNHDVSGDDTRGSTPYLETLGPQRFKKSPTFAGSDSTGYNTAHIFRAAGREWLLLAMDWRTSAGGFAWANEFIKDHSSLPVILTTHEIVGSLYDDNVYPYQAGDPENDAAFSSYGQTVWDELINDNDQIFLTLNGHYWPPGRVTMQNSAGNDVALHITNYQNRYFGGAAMLRLYHFDLVRNTIEVETISPWALSRPPAEHNVLAAQEARLTTPVDHFSLPIDFADRFGRFSPVTTALIRPASAVVIPGTLAYWRFDAGGADGTAVTASQKIRDLSGHGNDLTTLVTVPGSAANTLTWSAEHAPRQPGQGSLYFDGGQNPLHGAYLTTAAHAPLNTETFAAGFTIEAFVKIPLDWDSSDNSWMAVLSRWGESGQAGKSGANTDPNEPIATFSLSGDREPQWNAYPLNLTYPTTNWGQGLPEDTWWHLAVVNDGKHTIMYIEGCPTVDNPTLIQSTGITQLALPWALGGYEYGGVVNQIFHGWIGDVRIVNRPLSVGEFMIAH